MEARYVAPLPDLIFRAQLAHRARHRADQVQGCMLLSIKTGGCPEDCAYCPQSARYHTNVGRTDLVSLDELTEEATRARAQGATRFCMGAAWRDAPDGPQFDQVLEMVRVVRGLGMEACCTLGMLSQEQADALAGAGLTAYNHNLDTSPEFYGRIITTRTYDDRLATLARVRAAGITVCSGGIIGMREGRRTRCGLLRQLATLDPHAEDVPVNLLVRVAATPPRLQRSLKPPSGADFSSKDSLNFSTHPTMVARFIEGATREGCGSTGSRLLRGERESFRDVERRFARLKGVDRALYFSSGYL